MTINNKIEHIFVSVIPDNLDEGKLYICLKYNTAIHKCACGCGEEVVTPLSPSDWKMTYDGESISLYPSIGNWSYKCRSHYWIREDRIVWAELWSDKQIKDAREYNRQVKKAINSNEQVKETREKEKKSIWNILKSLFK